MTKKKQRQRLTMKIKRILGIDIATARKIARYTLDYKGFSNDIISDINTVLGEGIYTPDGCSYCGDHSFRWDGKKGFLTFQYGSFKVRENAP